MKASVCVLCDRAVTREGLLQILGAGVNRLGRPSLPAALDVDLALMLDPDDVSEVTGSHEVGVQIAAEDGTELARVAILFEIGEVDPQLDPLPGIPIPVGLRNVGVSAYGRYVVAIMYDGRPLASLRFSVDKQGATGSTQQMSAISSS